MSTKDLGQVFKSLGLQVEDEKLKFWADEADEDGKNSSKQKVCACAWMTERERASVCVRERASVCVCT